MILRAQKAPKPYVYNSFDDFETPKSFQAHLIRENQWNRDFIKFFIFFKILMAILKFLKFNKFKRLTGLLLDLLNDSARMYSGNLLNLLNFLNFLNFCL